MHEVLATLLTPGPLYQVFVSHTNQHNIAPYHAQSVRKGFFFSFWGR